MTLQGTTASHDVLIVGGGLVGASLAIALDRLDLDVGLVELAPPGDLPAVFDQRNLSFADATVNALDALGVMRRLRAPTGPIREIHVSRQGDFGRVRLRAADYGREAFGQVVVARDFGEALEQGLAALPRLTRYRPARYLGSVVDGDVRRIRIERDGAVESVQTRLLVGADGTASGVRDGLGIGVDAHDYGQALFVSRLRTDRPPGGVAWERLTTGGPTALLPRGDRHYGLVHGVLADEADAVAALDDAGFLARVQAVFGWRAGRFVEAGPRSRYPLRRAVAKAVAAPRAVLVGNAAQTLHPIGAQGFNLGLRDALILVEAIAASPRDAGQAQVLDTHVRRRHDDRERTLAFSDQLARLTSNPSGLLRPLRSAGLMALDLDSGLQAGVAGGAMGYRGEVPVLCRRDAS